MKSMLKEAVRDSRAEATAPNGAGAAAILAAGLGCFLLGVLTVLGDQSALCKALLNFYKPTGPLSGVTTVAVAVWLVAWAVLHWLWRKRDVPFSRIRLIAFALLALGIVLTLPF